MSATLGGGLGERVAGLLGQPPNPAPLLVSEGRAFPVRTVYAGGPGASQRCVDLLMTMKGFHCLPERRQCKAKLVSLD